jgi:MYXO-CTERM domain-containing protein
MTRAGRMALTIGAAALLGLTGAEAQAQFYIQTETATVFTPLASLPGVAGLTDFVFSSADEGVATVPIPFPFSYLGAPYNDVRVGVNGLLVFGNGAFGGYTNAAVGSYSSPNNMIAVWWDDLIIADVAGHATYGVLGTAPNRTFVIEVRDWEHYGLSGLDDGRYQVWLYEGPAGRFDVRYDRLLDDTENYSATAGWEGPNGDGLPNGVFRPCSRQSPYCSHVDYAGLTGRAFTVQRAQGPELTGAVGAFGRGALPGQGITVPVTLENLGTEPVSGTTHALFLSTDAALDPAQDIRIATFTTPLLDPSAGPVSLDVPAAVPPGTAAGDYTLLLAVDLLDDATEVSEQNNVVAAATRFATAYELRPVAVAVPVGARPGQPVQVDLRMANTAVPRTGTAPVALWASVDQRLDAQDVSLGMVDVVLSGAAQEDLQFSVTLPAGIGPGFFYPILQVDPQGTLPVLDRGDDLAAGTARFPTAPDLVPTTVTGPAGAEPGTTLVLNVVLENRGLAYAGPVRLRAIASPDPIYDLNDPLLGDVTVNLTLPAGTNQVVPVSVTVPPLLPGLHYPIVVVDPARQVEEADDYNNNRVGAARFATGPDLVIQDVTGPAEPAPGASVTFTTRIASVGAAYAGAARYALYLSRDAAWDAQDYLLGQYTVLMSGAGVVDDARTFPFPSVPPGTYTLIGRADPNSALAEADEGNNLWLDRDALATGPDFYMYSVYLDPDEAAPDTVVTWDGTFINQGSAYTGPVAYRIVLSADHTLGPDDLELTRGVIPLAGELTSFTVTATFSVSQAALPVPPGDYEVFIHLDPDDLIPEQDEADNDVRAYDDLEVLGPNPRVGQLTAAGVAFVGEPYVVQLQLDNPEALPAAGLETDIYLSGVGVLSEGRRLGAAPTVTVPAGGGVTVTATVNIPPDVTPGWYLLGAILDPRGLLAETDERDNLALYPGGVTVLPPSADLTGRVVETATAAAPGETLALRRILENRGIRASGPFTVEYILSADDAVGPEDLVLGAVSAEVAAGDTTVGLDVLEVPPAVPPGRYRVGLRVDPAGQVVEVDEANNAALGPWLQVYPADLAVLTPALPTGRLGLPYEAVLYAVGGTQPYRWTLVGGGLPPGLSLDRDTGFIRGTPTDDGAFSVEVEVASGPMTARRTLSLAVGSATVPLALAPVSLPAATLGRSYQAALLAVGGAPPYHFSAVSALPLGLSLAPDGALSGAPELPGTTTLLVRVEDAAGAVASGQALLRVLRPDHRVLITQSPLPSAQVDADYCDAEPILLFASGGVPPYRWSLRSAPPPGLTLAEDGALCGTPEQAGTFALELGVQDAGGGVDTSLFMLEVLPAGAFAIRTTRLPDAPPGVAYAATLEVAAATPPVTWRLELGTLPAGLVLAEDGQLTGTPTEEGRRAFLVQVEDARGQVRRQPLSILVATPAAADGRGCGCSTSGEPTGPGLAWGLALALALLGRRRR